MDTNATTLETEIRAWAAGTYGRAAGAELLIRHGRAIYSGAPWIQQWDGGFAGIDATTLVEETGAYSGGEKRVFAIAASLIDGIPVNLEDTLAGLDYDLAALVLAAVATATGYAEPVRTIRTVDNEPDWVTLPGLYAWPNRN